MNNDGVQKRALLIGINEYQYSGEGQPKTLKGCINDIELIAAVLRDRFGFKANRIVTLRDKEATRNRILIALDELVTRTGKNDIVVVHYSGHGSRMSDREGDKPDGMDETIVPHDSGRSPYENRDITDDELYLWLLRLSEKTPYITLIFDSCHSGGIVRDEFGFLDRAVEPDRRPLEELPPSPVGERISSKLDRDIGASGWLPLSKRYVLIASCAAEEKAYECLITGSYYGRLSYFLATELQSSPSEATYRDILESVSTRMGTEEFWQNPQLEGYRDRLLFQLPQSATTRSIEPLSFVGVRRYEEAEVTLNAGAIQGLTVGSHWKIYPQSTKSVLASPPQLGTIETTVVRAVTADAKILTECEPRAIKTGCRAIEFVRAWGEMRLVVKIANDIEERVPLLGQSPLLRSPSDGELADACVYLLPARSFPQSPVPQLGTISEPTWAVVGRSGQLLMPAYQHSLPDATLRIRNNLDKIARYRSALKIENSNRASALNGKVKFALQQQIANGEWKNVPSSPKGRLPIFTEGDRLRLEITNSYNYDIYVSILDFGLTYSISPLYPVEGAKQRFLPSKCVKVGEQQGQEVELYFPGSFPLAAPDDGRSANMGQETFKLFATLDPSDFSPLLQGGARTSQHPLERLLELALLGRPDRDAKPVRLAPNLEWTTVERSFFLQRG